MIITTLPKIETHEDLFFSYKQDNEFLGIASLPLTELNLYDAGNKKLSDSVKMFFAEGIHTPIQSVPLYSNEKKDEYTKYQIMLENYTKAVWLTRDYINSGTFKNPIGVHWNSQNKIWDIHPGGSRKKVINYFEKNTEVEVLAFNSGGKSLLFKKKFFSLDEIKKYYQTNDLSIVCTADHGSIIPHIHFDQSDMRNNILKSIHHVQNFYKTTKIIANFDLSFLNYKENISRTVSTIKVTVDDVYSMDNILRALLLVPSFDNFNDYGVKIEPA